MSMNDLDRGVKSKLYKPVHDTKVGGEVGIRGGGDQIQEGIDTCTDWVKHW